MDTNELRDRAEMLGMAILFGGAVAFVKVTDKGGQKTTSLDVVFGQGSPAETRISGVVHKVEAPKWRDCQSGSRQACTSSAQLEFSWPSTRQNGSVNAGNPAPAPSTAPATESDLGDEIDV